MFNSLFYKLTSILSGRLVSIAIILLAIAARIIQLVFFYNIRVDASYQVMATEHFVNGHGISLASVNPANLSEVIYKPLLNWPPGYSLLLCPFYLLYGGNYIAAGITLDIMMAIALIFACRAILQRLGCSLAMQNLCTLINGFFIYYFYFIASSDAIAISFFSLILFFTVKLLQQNGKDNSSLFWIIALSFMVALIKYLFIPVVFVIPLYLLVAGHLSKQRSIRKAGLLSFGILLVLNAGFLLYQIGISGQAGYISSPERGLFTEHLLNIYPFVIASFINPETLALLVRQNLENTSILYKCFIGINFGLIIYITVHFLKAISKRKPDKVFSIPQAFYTICFHLSVVVFHVLAILSLQVSKEEILPGYFWTYVEEPRYYGLIVLLFHLAVFVFYKHSLPKVSLLPRVFFYTFCFLLLLETSRGIYLTAHRIKKIGKEEYSWQYEDRFQKAVGGVIEKAKLSYPQIPVIITGSSYYYNHRVSLYSHVPILYEFNRMLDTVTLKSTNPVIVVSVISKKDFPNPKLTKETIGEWQGEFENFSIYTKNVPAN